MRQWVVALLLLAGPAAGQGLKEPAPPESRLAGLPAELAGWRRGGVTDFEARPGGAGLGAGAEYRPAAGGPGIATVYLYDRGLTGLRDGTGSAEVEGEIRSAVGEVEAIGPLRRYQIVQRGAPLDIAGTGGRPGLHCQPLVLAFEGGNRADSTVCLGVVQGKFLKLRMTLPATAEEVSAKALTGFGQALLAELQPAPPVSDGKRLTR